MTVAWGRTRGLRLKPIIFVVTVLTFVLGAWGGSTRAPTRPSATPHAPRYGGTMKVLEQSDAQGTWSSLDPTSPNPFLDDYFNAIYGQLFAENDKDPLKPLPDLATGYSLTNNAQTLTIDIRPGVKFTDGSTFDSSAVAFNFRRDLAPSTACTCAASFPVTSISTPNATKVVLQLSKPDPPIALAFENTAMNYIISPTALQTEGPAKFAITPVGAGPFIVKSDSLSNELVLTRNPHYWQKGRPYLNELDFTSIGNDTSAIETLYAGQGHAYRDMTAASVRLIPQIKSHGFKIAATHGPGTTVLDLQLDTLTPPFNNILAREALFYATNRDAIVKHLWANAFTATESPTVPGGDFYEPKVPGTRSYNPAKAKALVKQLGGLSFTITTYQSLGLEDTAQALAQEFKAVGINANVQPMATATVVKDFKSHSWQAFVGGAGGVDPALGNGLGFFFASTGPDSGLHNPTVDSLLTTGAQALTYAKRAAAYRQLFGLINSQAYALFLFAEPGRDIVANSVQGYGMSSLNHPWQNVWLSKQS